MSRVGGAVAVMNTVIFLPNWVGDVVMSTPVIRAMRSLLSDRAQLIGVAHPRVMDVLSGNAWFDALIPYARDAADRRHRFWPVVRQLRRANLETAVILPNTPHHAALALLAGARRRVGYNRRGRGLLLTTRLAPLKQGGAFVPCSTLDYYLDLALAAGCVSPSRDMELFTTEAEELSADAVWKAQDWSASDRIVAINNGGAFGPAKRWPDEYAIEIARRIGTIPGCRALFICGPDEQAFAARAAADAGAASLAGYDIGLGLTKAGLKRCALLVTTDSGPRHMAAAFGVPVITLFGPTDERWSDTGYQKEIQLHHAINCRPCQQRTCPLGHHRCMRDLSVDTVWSVVKSALGVTP